MERFGAAEVQEAQKAQKEEQNGGGFKMNRRRNKMFRKNFQNFYENAVIYGFSFRSLVLLIQLLAGNSN